jgi:glutamine cyclotransferase
MVASTLHIRNIAQTLTLAICLLGPGFARAAPIYGYKVIAKYPHSTASYTEGFFYLDGKFYDGTGVPDSLLCWSLTLIQAPYSSVTIFRRNILEKASSIGALIFSSEPGNPRSVWYTTAFPFGQ